MRRILPALAWFFIALPALANTYVLVSAAGIVEAAPYTPQSGHTIQGDVPPDMNWIDVTALPSPPGLGSTYNPSTRTFAAPVLPLVPAPAIPTTITPLDFMARLTPAEQTAIATASQSNAQVLLFLLKLAGAQDVSVTDPLTVAGIQAMVAAGLLTVDRGAQVLDLSRASP